ncbi:MAG: arylsulfatase [Opitutales bacterium]|nr:arylsulfatase [Opitutales bacterium]
MLSINSIFGRDPNVIIILADDLGYGDCEPNNSSSKIKTPYLSKLAEEGLCFIDAHAASATCTPSRYGLLTGINPSRTGVLNTLLSRGEPIIGKEEKTLADLFRSKGYRTHMVGKWHLGFSWDKKWTDQPLRGGPIDRGFNTFFGIHSSAGSDPLCFLEQDRLAGQPTEPITFPKYSTKGEKVIKHAKAAPGFTIEGTSKALIERTIHLLKEHSINKNKKPFFLYYASPIPHQPWVPMKKFRGKSGLGDYGDFVMQLDWVVGEINQALKKYGLDQNTLLIFTSDNGAGPPAYKAMSEQGHASSEKYRGMKASGYEGGHRVPFIVKWPGKAKAGTTSKSTINFTDFFATFSEMLGLDHRKEFPSAVDSQSFLSALMSPKKKFSRQPMIHRSNTMRIEKWKWIHPSRSILFSKANPNEFEVYNLEKDPGEQINLAPKKPKLRQKFFQTYQQFNQEIKLK